jgi:hypothetical protein
VSERDSISSASANTIDAVSGRNGVGTVGRRSGNGSAAGRNGVRTAGRRNGNGAAGTAYGAGTVTDRTRRIRERNDHDAATVLAVVLALSGTAGSEEPTATAEPPSVWSDPAFRLEGARHPSPVAWWASAMPR